MKNVEYLYYVHKDNKQFINLLNKVKNDSEKEKENILYNMILDFYQKIYDNKAKELSYTFFDYDFSGCGYSDELGYYSVIYDGFGYNYVRSYNDNTNMAFINIVNSILSKQRSIFQNENKKKIKNEYIKRFGDKQLAEIAFHVEYDLDKWNKYYDGNISEDVISVYQSYLNLFNNMVYHKGNIMEIDVATNSVIFKNDAKIKKLRKTNI